MPHTRLLTHVVFATGKRQPWLAKDVRGKVYSYISGVCKNVKCHLIIAGDVEDHVHLLVDIHPTVCVADFVRDTKANSSRFVHQTFPKLAVFAWQESYGAFAVSSSMESKVRTYIQNEESHHRRRSFMDELRELHERHGLRFRADEWE